MSVPIRTRFRGDYISNDDLQKFLLKESADALKIGFKETAECLRELSDKLQNLKE